MTKTLAWAAVILALTAGSAVVSNGTEVGTCWFRTVSDGRHTISVLSSGYLQQGRRADGTRGTTDERHVTEFTEAWYGSCGHVCHRGGSLPIGWSSECWGMRTYWDSRVVPGAGNSVQGGAG